MKHEKKICQNCKQEFTIVPGDFAFYEKIKVPPPTWCSECRAMRRMAWREEHTFYRDTCKLCKKPIISIHLPDGPFTVYCRECWNSDKWDPMDYGRGYDFNQPFFSQYRKLMEAVPRPALTGINVVQSDFSHGCESCKNCYYTFFSYYSQDSQYSYGLLLSRDTYDSFVVDNSDHAYESLHSNRIYQVRFGYFADDCLNSSFLFDCVGCSDCFGCVNLRKQKYCIFNEKLQKDEYKSRMSYWDLGSFARLQEAKEKFRSLYLSIPHRYAHIRNSQNVTGDIIRDSKDCQVCFTTLDGVQNCKYVYSGWLNLKDSYDVSAGGDTSELLYEIFGTTQSQQALFSVGGTNCRNVIYCDWPYNSSDLFGCIALKHKRHCILNKQYSRDEYEKLVSKIKGHMDEMPYIDKKGREYKFGEFFPTELSAYAYNESFAFSWYPKTKEETFTEGWKWRDPEKRSYQITLQPENLPDHIRDAVDSITGETVGCMHRGECNEQCTTAFRITREELNFYRTMNIALPRLCPNCRHAERLRWRNGFHLWERKCMCSSHGHFHKADSCPNEFQTTYSPDRPEIIYCDQCYKAEFL